MSELSLLAQLGSQLGLDNLEFDEAKQCLLALDESLFISIRDEGEHWVFCGMLDSLAEVDAVAGDGVGIYRDLLRISFQLAWENRGSIGIDQERRAVLLIHSVPLQEMSAARLFAELERFAHTLEKTIGLLKEGGVVEKKAGLAESGPEIAADRFI